MSDIEKAKEHIKNLANDYKCCDNTISFEEALALNEALQNPCKVCDYFAEDIHSYCRKSQGVLDQIAEEQKTLLDTTKAWSKALEHGDIY